MTHARVEAARPARPPGSAGYGFGWVASLATGLYPLWQLEDLLEDVEIAPGARVLDLGCGKGATSVFLARETGAQVTAFDLWIPADELRATLEAADVGDQVRVVHGDALQLPFADGEFDAVISIDAFEYFGTDVHFLPSLLRVVKLGGRIGMSTPAVRVDPYDQDPAAYVTDVGGWEAAAWHSPAWWERHWKLTGLGPDHAGAGRGRPDRVRAGLRHGRGSAVRIASIGSGLVPPCGRPDPMVSDPASRWCGAQVVPDVIRRSRTRWPRHRCRIR